MWTKNFKLDIWINNWKLTQIKPLAQFLFQIRLSLKLFKWTQTITNIGLSTIMILINKYLWLTQTRIHIEMLNFYSTWNKTDTQPDNFGFWTGNCDLTPEKCGIKLVQKPFETCSYSIDPTLKNYKLNNVNIYLYI